MDDFSIESLYEIGLGFKKNDSVGSSISIEKWDGDRDSLAYEMASAEALLDTIDTYSRMTKLNSVQQIKCANRINANYGCCNRGIESYCRNVIHSAESDGSDVGQDTNPTPDPKNNETPDKPEAASKKKDAWYKKVFGVISRALSAIWNFIKSIPSRVKGLINKIRQKRLDSQNKAIDKDKNNIVDKLVKAYEKTVSLTESTIKLCNGNVEKLNAILKGLEGKTVNIEHSGPFDPFKVFTESSKIIIGLFNVFHKCFTSYVSEMNALIAADKSSKKDSKDKPNRNGDMVAKLENLHSIGTGGGGMSKYAAGLNDSMKAVITLGANMSSGGKIKDVDKIITDIKNNVQKTFDAILKGNSVPSDITDMAKFDDFVKFANARINDAKNEGSEGFKQVRSALFG